MKSNIVDVNVYIITKTNEEFFSKLAEKINTLTGVITVNINKKVKRMLNIKYDTNQVSGSEIVKFIGKNECRGALVGF